MLQPDHELLDLLKFELKFLEDGGYGRSPHTPSRAQRVFEDSLSCPNYADPSRPLPCTECQLMRFVPDELRDQDSPCRLIPLTAKGETIDYFYRYGSQLELEEALAGWLRKQISQMERPIETPPVVESSKGESKGLDRIRRRQWLVLAGNLYALANLRREDHDYLIAQKLYGRALAAGEKVAALGDTERSLVERIRKDQQAVSEILRGGAESAREAPPEEIDTVAP